MSYMRDVDGNRLDDLAVQRRIQLAERRKPVEPVTIGTNSEVITVDMDAGGDGTLTNIYAYPTPAAGKGPYPADFGRVHVLATAVSAQTSPAQNGYYTFRTRTDAQVVVFQYYNALSTYGTELYVDGLYVGTFTTAATPATYHFMRITFPSAGKPRLIEWYTPNGVGNMYCAPPYRFWKPAPRTDLEVLVVGDSFAVPVMLSNTLGSQVYTRSEGMYQSLATRIGLQPGSVLLNAWSGSGYVAEVSANQHYEARLPALTYLDPDVVIFHGGGLNDINAGVSDADTIAAAISCLQLARTQWPHAKLVFVEGISTTFAVTPSNWNSRYTAIRAAVQAACPDVYYIDVATTAPWLDGTGKVTATTGNGNNDVYTGYDGIHPTVKGHAYLRDRLVPKLLRVINDSDWSLVGTLI